MTSGTSSAADYEQYGWDANGNLTSLRTRGAQNVALGYDALNRPTLLRELGTSLQRRFRAVPAPSARRP